jgi:hypothetical protein
MKLAALVPFDHAAEGAARTAIVITAMRQHQADDHGRHAPANRFLGVIEEATRDVVAGKKRETSSTDSRPCWLDGLGRAAQLGRSGDEPVQIDMIEWIATIGYGWSTPSLCKFGIAGIVWP